MIYHTDSLVLVWKIAELEARNLKSEQIEPEHFFLGILKVTDIRLERVLSKLPDLSAGEIHSDVDELKACIKDYILESTQMRRRFRRRLARLEKSFNPEVKTIRRSKLSRNVFKEAEKVSELFGGRVTVIHLLVALLRCRTEAISNLLDTYGIEPDQFERHMIIKLSDHSKGRSI